jgi:hypothetical protein
MEGILGKSAVAIIESSAAPLSGETQKWKVGASKSGMCVERARAESREVVEVDGQGVVKGRGEDEAPPRGRAPVERAKVECGP